MTACERCLRGRLVADAAGEVQCLSCSWEPGAAVIPLAPAERVCRQGHMMEAGRCPTCLKSRGHATKANAAQREGMSYAIVKGGGK